MGRNKGIQGLPRGYVVRSSAVLFGKKKITSLEQLVKLLKQKQFKIVNSSEIDIIYNSITILPPSAHKLGTAYIVYKSAAGEYDIARMGIPMATESLKPWLMERTVEVTSDYLEALPKILLVLKK